MTQVCIVTGATRGIGRAVAANLRSDGYDVVGLARSRPDWWSGAFIVCDLTDRMSLGRACDQIRSVSGLWGLVNNAGIGLADSIEEITVDDMARVFMANTIAPALLTQAAISGMSDGGRILNVCSTGLLGKAERSSYGASKAALASLTRTWALELGSRQITVNAVSPGPIETELFRSRNPAGSELEREILAGIPTHRLGDTAQIADLASFLFQPEHDYFNGQVMIVDGGGSTGKAPF